MKELPVSCRASLSRYTLRNIYGNKRYHTHVTVQSGSSLSIQTNFLLFAHTYITRGKVQISD